MKLRKFASKTQNNISVRGGTDKVKYFVSGGYFYQESLYRSNDLKNKKYNLRSNLDVALTEKLKFGFYASFLFNYFYTPLLFLDFNLNIIYDL